MSRPLPAIIVFLVAAGPLHAADPMPADAKAVSSIRVLPVLKAKCFACHGEDTARIKGGLALTSRAALIKGGDSGTPGGASESPLDMAVTRTDADFSGMPPKEDDKPSDAEVEAIRVWIGDAATWPSAGRVAEPVHAARPVGMTGRTSGGLSPDWASRTYKPEDLWAYRPLRKPTGPAVAGASNPIDAFIGARLGALGLVPASSADRRTFIRRATFDQIGLPETFLLAGILPSAADFVPVPHPADVGPEVRGLMEVCLVIFNTNEFAHVD